MSPKEWTELVSLKPGQFIRYLNNLMAEKKIDAKQYAGLFVKYRSEHGE